MASKYSKVPIGGIFDARGGKYRKVDDLYYEDLNTGFQAVWNPVFDDGIAGQAGPAPTGEVNTKDKFLVDPQNRVLRTNPNYTDENNETSKLFAEMWGSGLFDCGPTDYAYMALKAIKAVSLVQDVISILNSVEVPTVTSDEIVWALNKWADRLILGMRRQPWLSAPSFYVTEEEEEKFELQPVKTTSIRHKAPAEQTSAKTSAKKKAPVKKAAKKSATKPAKKSAKRKK